jgi:hypothetical protein
MFGQSVQYGKLTGKIQLETGELLPGVTVEVSSDSLVTAKRVTVTSENGTYIFLNLPKGIYTLSASLENFKKAVQENIAVKPGASMTINMVLEQGIVEETIIVSAAAPVVDVKTSTIDTRVDKEMLQKLPSSRDAFYDLALSTPGMADGGKDASWLPSPSAYGGDSNDNIFLVNGVNATNPRGASWGSLVNVNYSTVEEVRVVSLGSKAEYGSFSGVAIDVMTKSGGNRFHGALGYYSLLGNAADNQNRFNYPVSDSILDVGPNDSDWLVALQNEQLMTKPEKDYEINLTLGGPVIKNKIWFFSGFVRSREDIMTAEKPLQIGKSSIFDFKLTAEPFGQFRSWAAYHYENGDRENQTWGEAWDKSMAYDQHTQNHTISTQAQWYPGDRTFLSAKYLGFWTDDNPTANENYSNTGYINWWKWVNYNLGEGGMFPHIEAQKSKRNTIQTDVSHYAENFLGEHDLKCGVQYTMSQGNWVGGYFQNVLNTAYPAPEDREVDLNEPGLLFYVNQKTSYPTKTVRNSDSFGVFLDDQWTLSNRLTVNIGLRYDHMTANYGPGKVYQYLTSPKDVNNNLIELRDREGSNGNVFDFKTFSPRAGLTFALTEDNRTVFRANYGRYYKPLCVENLSRFGPDMPDSINDTLWYYVPWEIADRNGDGYIDNGDVKAATAELRNLTPAWTDDSYTSNDSWACTVANGTKDEYVDQINLSLEREILQDLTVQFSYIHKRSGNMLVGWPIDRLTGNEWQWETLPFTSYNGETINIYSIKDMDYDNDGDVDWDDAAYVIDNTTTQVRNMPEFEGLKPKKVFHGFQLVFQKRFSNRWQMLSSFLLTSSDGLAARTTDQRWNISGNMIMDNAFGASLNQFVRNMRGELPFTPKFEFKFNASYNVPVVNLDMGMRFRFHTGRALWVTEDIPLNYRWDGERLAGTVLSDTGEVSVKIIGIDPEKPRHYPNQAILDLNLGKSFSFNKFGSLTVSVDVLNVFNAATPNSIGWVAWSNLGQVSSLIQPRVFRVGLSYDF